MWDRPWSNFNCTRYSPRCSSVRSIARPSGSLRLSTRSSFIRVGQGCRLSGWAAAPGKQPGRQPHVFGPFRPAHSLEGTALQWLAVPATVMANMKRASTPEPRAHDNHDCMFQQSLGTQRFLLFHLPCYSSYSSVQCDQPAPELVVTKLASRRAVGTTPVASSPSHTLNAA